MREKLEELRSTSEAAKAIAADKRSAFAAEREGWGKVLGGCVELVKPVLTEVTDKVQLGRDEKGPIFSDWKALKLIESGDSTTTDLYLVDDGRFVLVVFSDAAPRAVVETITPSEVPEFADPVDIVDRLNQVLGAYVNGRVGNRIREARGLARKLGAVSTLLTGS